MKKGLSWAIVAIILGAIGAILLASSVPETALHGRILLAMIFIVSSGIFLGISITLIDR